MDQDSVPKDSDKPEVPLVPAAAVGFLLYPFAVQLILANPPANDSDRQPSPG